jgi:hypothetical protein
MSPARVELRVFVTSSPWRVKYLGANACFPPPGFGRWRESCARARGDTHSLIRINISHHETITITRLSLGNTLHNAHYSSRATPCAPSLSTTISSPKLLARASLQLVHGHFGLHGHHRPGIGGRSRRTTKLRNQGILALALSGGCHGCARVQLQPYGFMQPFTGRSKRGTCTLRLSSQTAHFMSQRHVLVRLQRIGGAAAVASGIHAHSYSNDFSI